MLVHQDKVTQKEKTHTEYERVAKKMRMSATRQAVRKPNVIRRRRLLHRAGVSYVQGGEATKSSLAETVGLEGKDDLMDIYSSDDATSVNE
jgi:hypothetical protein